MFSSIMKVPEKTVPGAMSRGLKNSVRTCIYEVSGGQASSIR